MSLSVEAGENDEGEDQGFVEADGVGCAGGGGAAGAAVAGLRERRGRADGEVYRGRSSERRRWGAAGAGDVRAAPDESDHRGLRVRGAALRFGIVVFPGTNCDLD